MRPRVGVHSIAGLLLASAPNFIVSVCFPFGILVVPAFSKRTTSMLFAIWCIGATSLQIAFEFRSPLPGPHTRDPNDIIASIAGAVTAAMLYRVLEYHAARKYALSSAR